MVLATFAGHCYVWGPRVYISGYTILGPPLSAVDLLSYDQSACIMVADWLLVAQEGW